MTLAVFITALVTAMIMNNVLLMRYLGICSFVGVSTKMKSALGMGLAVLAIMLLATLITYPLYYGVLKTLDIAHIDTIVFILVIATLVQITEMLLKRFLPALYKNLGVYLPLITTNCAILGVAQTGTEIMSFAEVIAFSLGSGLGYLFVMVIFTAIRVRLDSANIPKAFKGAPIAFITAGLMALAFMSLSGLAFN